ncbi:MAG: sigma 54-interacting transcriptional regulator, partial [Wenzhouxiangellaceae bacterium]
AVQEKVLRIVEYGEFERLGSSTTRTIDVRVVGATNEDLPGLAASGRFRADLLDRLSFDVITLPPLRERHEDILPLAEHFAMRMSRELGRELFAGFSDSAIRQMRAHPWPGNVRELKNVVERAVYRHDTPDRPIRALQFDPFESPWRPQPESGNEPAGPKRLPDDLRGWLDTQEKAIVERALGETDGNRKRT